MTFLIRIKTKRRIVQALIVFAALVAVQLVIDTENMFYSVASESMEPALHVYDILVVNPEYSFDNVAVGDIIVFHRPEGGERIIVHRVVEMLYSVEGDKLLRTKGDANPSSIPGTDFPITETILIGKVTFVIPKLGFVTQFLAPPVEYYITIGAFIIWLVYYIRNDGKRHGNKAYSSFNEGMAYRQSGQHDKAIECFDRANTVNPNLAMQLEGKAQTLIDLGKYDEAIATCERISSLNPEYNRAFYIKGNAFIKTARPSEAIECYDQILKKDPDDTEILQFKANALHALGHHEEEIACYNEVLDKKPDLADAWYCRAKSKVKSGDLEGGLLDLGKALDLQREHYSSLAANDKEFEALRTDNRFASVLAMDSSKLSSPAHS